MEEEDQVCFTIKKSTLAKILGESEKKEPEVKEEVAEETEE